MKGPVLICVKNKVLWKFILASDISDKETDDSSQT